MCGDTDDVTLVMTIPRIRVCLRVFGSTRLRVEARKLEHRYPHGLKAKYRGS